VSAINYQDMRFDPHPTQRMVFACCARIAELEDALEDLELTLCDDCWAIWAEARTP